MENYYKQTIPHNSNIQNIANNAIVNEPGNLNDQSMIDFNYIKYAVGILIDLIKNNKNDEIENIINHILSRKKIFKLRELVLSLFPEDVFNLIVLYCLNSDFQTISECTLNLIFSIIERTRCLSHLLFQEEIVMKLFSLSAVFISNQNTKGRDIIVNIVVKLSYFDPSKSFIFWDIIKNSAALSNFEKISDFIYNEVDTILTISNQETYNELFIIIDNILNNSNIIANSKIYMCIKKCIDLNNTMFISKFIQEQYIIQLLTMTQSRQLKSLINDGYLVLTSFLPKIDPNEIEHFQVFYIDSGILKLLDSSNICQTINISTTDVTTITFLYQIIHYHPILFFSLTSDEIVQLLNIIIQKCEATTQFKVRKISSQIISMLLIKIEDPIILSSTNVNNIIMHFLFEHYQLILHSLLNLLLSDISVSSYTIKSLIIFTEKLFKNDFSEDSILSIFEENDFLKLIYDNDYPDEVSQELTLLTQMVYHSSLQTFI